METVALVAPVTSLEFLRDDFLLTGEGPVLSVYSLQPCPKACASVSVLQHYRIHGIRPRSQPAESSVTAVHREKKKEPSFYDLAVFGGKAVRLVRFHTDPQDGEHPCLEILGPLVELKDWALDVRWLPGNKQPLLCVAVAHNSALLLDVITGDVLTQRSCLEGCLLYFALLLVHESWADTVLVGGTVFNQLVLWKPGGHEGSDPERKAPVERRLLGHTGIIFSISYLQEKGYLASASDDRSIRIWGVGALGGLGGKCGDLNPPCLRVLYGHQARVFSVHLSPGKVFSAGEDGACLVWDWAEDGKVVRMLKGHRAGGVRALAVSEETGNEERWVATGGADGGVRLWKVEDSEEKEESIEEEVTENLTDLKLPNQGLPKAVSIVGQEDENTNWSQRRFVVCTDKGTVSQYSDGKWDTIWQGTPEFQSYCVMETVTVSVKSSNAQVHLCAVGNLSGSLQVFPTSHPQCGILLTGGAGKIHSLIWHKGKESAHLLASGAEGLVYRWCIDVKVDENSSLALSVNPLPPFLLPTCAKRWLIAAVSLQLRSKEVLWVCGDRRGSLLLFQEREKSEEKKENDEESKEGELTDRKQTEENGSSGGGKLQELMLQPLSCLFGVHGKQGVTSVCEYQGLLYSTGRDGCVRVFRVHPAAEKPEENKHSYIGKSAENKARLQLEVLRVQRACKGMEWLERILFLEPEIPVNEEELREECETNTREYNLTENKDRNEGREARFVIVGFHAVHFVVWDPVRQERLLAVPCGGGHRSWSLWPTHRGVWPGYGALVFIKQGAVLVSQPPGEAPGWAGRARGTGGWSLREGIHGRMIGCVCRLGRIGKCTANIVEIKGGEVEMRKEVLWEIVVTGGEDTSLTILAVNPISGSIKVLSVITDHISNVRTITTTTRPDKGSKNPANFISAVLVSAGGRAQIHCYRLLITWEKHRPTPSCQVIQVASHRLDEQWDRRRNRHKTVKMDPETRYMSIAVVDEKEGCILLALSCSDGAVRLFSVSEVKCQIELLWETFYHQRCVLSVTTCSLEDDKGNRYKLLFSAATDGKIAVWHLTEASATSMDNSSGTAAVPIPCLNIPAHQSGVNSLAVWAEKPGQHEDGCLVTVASGGDDGQLTVSTIRVQYPENGEAGGSRGFSHVTVSQTQFQRRNHLQLYLQSQSNILLAHAAPLTDLKLLTPGLVVSTSADQRVCLWRVCSAGISHSGALCSHIADAAGLAVWERPMMDRGEKGKTRFEQKIAMLGGKKHQRGLEETAGGEPVEAASETDNPVCQTGDEKGGETTAYPGNEIHSYSIGETEIDINTDTGLKVSCESRTNRAKVGYVLVCGQGFQLIRVEM